LQRGGVSVRQDLRLGNGYQRCIQGICTGFALQVRLRLVQKSNEYIGLAFSDLRSRSALHKPDIQRRSWGGGSQQTADIRERDQYHFHIYCMVLLSPKGSTLRGHFAIHKRCIVFDKDAQFPFQGLHAVIRQLLNKDRG
jgi:hypothetical protein